MHLRPLAGFCAGWRAFVCPPHLTPLWGVQIGLNQKQKNNANKNTNIIMKTKELYDMLDEKLASTNKEVETRVSRFYSSENYVVVATTSYDPHTHEDIVSVMRQHDFALYDVGGNCEYYMLTFKRQTA